MHQLGRMLQEAGPGMRDQHDQVHAVHRCAGPCCCVVVLLQRMPLSMYMPAVPDNNRRMLMVTGVAARWQGQGAE